MGHGESDEPNASEYSLSSGACRRDRWVAYFRIFACHGELETQFIVTESRRVLDDLCGGLIAAFIIYRYERRRSKYLNEGLKTIELMNHHVRNALNVIVLSANGHSHGKLLEGIQASVGRIDWALREILPGRVLDDYDENAAEKKQSHSAASLD